MIRSLDLKRLHAPYQKEMNEAAIRVVESGMYLLGEELQVFEKEFAQYCGTKYALGVANGLDALMLVLQAWKIQNNWADEDEVLVPANTYIASVLAISAAGLKPVFVDANLTSMNIDIELVEKKITKRTRAIMPVHLYGRLVEVDLLVDLANTHGLKILEDAAQSHGAYWNGLRAGNLGHAAGFSLYPGKNLGALGDAGIITTNDPKIIDLVNMLRNYGSVEKYVHKYQGRNSRLDEIQAAMLQIKLRHLDHEIEGRRKIADKYAQQIQNDQLVLPDFGEHQQHVWHQFVIRTARRNELIEHLKADNIGTIIHYPIPPFRQEAYSEMSTHGYPIADQLSAQVLSIPIYSALDDSETDTIIASLNSFETS